MVKVWHMVEHPENPREECNLEPPSEVSLEALADIGVFYDFIDPGEREEKLQVLAKERGYAHSDEVKVSPTLLPDYEEKIKYFFEEHLHNDDEIRYVIDGCGYFDVRDRNDQWVRIKSEPGDMITIPAGIFHRFTPNTDDFIHAKRFFKDNPEWKVHERKHEETSKMLVRQQYLQKYGI